MNQLVGYHLANIPRGEFGEFSKIEEEFLEAKDAHLQYNNVMVLQELSDLLGAIDEYVKKYNMTLTDLLKMTEATKRAFVSGHRS